MVLPDLALRPFSAAFNDAQLATRLRQLVEGNSERIARQFPLVPRRYNSENALVTVRQLRDVNLKSGFRPHVITCDGVVIGVATLWQMRLRRHPLVPFSAVITDGPQFAFWLGARQARSGFNAQLVPHLLRLIEDRCKELGMRGKMWTVVRTDHPYMRAQLVQTDAGDGFIPTGRPRKYRLGDGVDAPRQLFVARASL